MLQGSLYTAGSPLIIVAGALLKDNINGNILAQLKFQSLSELPIKAVTARIIIRDSFGRTLGKAVIKPYCDLTISRGEYFGQKIPIRIPEVTAREFSADILEVAFTDGSVWHAPKEAVWEALETQKELACGEELRKQYRLDFCEQAKYQPLFTEDLWFCLCGAPNRLNDECCHACGVKLSQLQNFDLVKLKTNCKRRLKKEAKKRATIEKVLLAAIALALLCVAVVLLFLIQIIPSRRYNSALALENEGQYREAAALYSQLGDYKDAKRRSLILQNLGNVISAGGVHTVGLMVDGSVIAAGDNKRGQCNVSDWTDIVEVSAGFYHTVGLNADGTVVAVGNNDEGQCNVSDWTDVVAIAAGALHTIGLKTDGTVVAVGYNDNRQCNVSGWTDITSVSAGFDHTVGLKSDGTVVAVGRNASGQCDVTNWTNIVALSAGDNHTVGLKADGTVVAVGYNDDGQCDVSGWTDIISVSAGTHHTVGLRSDGTVLVAGTNYFGQCNVTNWVNIVSVSAGFVHTIGLRADGTVVAAGVDGFSGCDVSNWRDVKLPE